MICDDSSVIRRLVRGALTADPQMHIVYEAVNGKDALDNVESVRPDVVLMDVEMPIMDGIDAVHAIRRRFRTLPIIMFSSLTGQGAEATMDALAAGANDFAIKPTGSNNLQSAKDQVQIELTGKIRNLVGTPADEKAILGLQKAAPGGQGRTASPSRREAAATSEASTFGSPRNCVRGWQSGYPISR